MTDPHVSPTGEPIPDDVLVKLRGRIELGDVSGHDFHGNQWTNGHGGAQGSPRHYRDHTHALHMTTKAAADDIKEHGFNPLYGTRIGSQFGQGIYASLETHSGLEIQDRFGKAGSTQLEIDVATNKQLFVDPGWEIESDAWLTKLHEQAGVTNEELVIEGAKIEAAGLANWREYGQSGDPSSASKSQIDGFSDWLLEKKGEMAATPFIDGKSQALREVLIQHGYDSIVYRDPTGHSGMGDMIVAMHSDQVTILNAKDINPPAQKIFKGADPNQTEAELLAKGYTPKQVRDIKGIQAAGAPDDVELMCLTDFLHLMGQYDEQTGEALFATQVLEFGDSPGHDFHGNQWTGGGGGGSSTPGHTRRGLEGNAKLTHAMLSGLPSATKYIDETTEADLKHAKAELVAAAAAGIASAVSHDPAVKAEYESWRDGINSNVRGLATADQYGQQRAQKYVDTWANSAADDNAVSLALQRSTADELNAQSASFDSYLSREMTSPYGLPMQSAADRQALVDRVLTSEGATMRSFVRDEYDRTQSYLADHDISSVTLYRGMGFGKDDVPSPFHYNGNYPVSMNPASSWSLDPGVAAEFTGRGEETNNAFIITMTVPAEDIISTARTGRGALSEGEVIVRSQPGQIAAVERADAMIR